MANFLTSFNKAMKWEGLYSDDPRDPGLETFRGVSRRYNPNWIGWYVVDSCKDEDDFPKCLELESDLPKLVQDFYITNFWKPIMGFDIRDQDCADKFLSMAILLGVKGATKLMQEAIVAVIEHARHCKPFIIVVDGKMGSATLAALNGVDPHELLEQFKAKCIATFKSKNNPVYIKGWINRVED